VYHLEGILRHAYCCPFKDMRDRCQALLQWTAVRVPGHAQTNSLSLSLSRQDQNHPIPKLLNNSPSSFIAAKHCVHFNDPEKEDLQALLEESFAVKVSGLTGRCFPNPSPSNAYDRVGQATSSCSCAFSRRLLKSTRLCTASSSKVRGHCLCFGVITWPSW